MEGMVIDVPDTPEKGDPIQFTPQEASELTDLLQDLFDDIPDDVEIDSAHFAKHGTSFKHHVILHLDNEDTYGLRPLREAADASLAADILAKAHVPNHSPQEEARAPDFLSMLSGKIAVYRWVRGDPRSWKDPEVDVGQDIADNREAFLEDFGAWVCAGPVLALSDANNQGNFVWDIEGKRFARVDFQSVFGGPRTIQSMLVVLGWIPGEILTEEQLRDAIASLGLPEDGRETSEKDDDGDDPQEAAGAEEIEDPGVRAFVDAFTRTHERLEATMNAWLPDLRAQAPDPATEDIRQWVETGPREKLQRVAQCLPEGEAED